MDDNISQYSLDEGPKGKIDALKVNQISLAEMEMEQFRKQKVDTDKYEVSENTSAYYPDSDP